MRCLWTIIAAGLLAATTATATAAAPERGLEASVFVRCDGYWNPSKSGDGMTQALLAWRFTVFDEYSARGVPTEIPMGAPGVAACDQALADPLLLPQFKLRRVSLLTARAVHDIAAGRPSDALADLEKAEAAAPEAPDVYYRRSLGLGIDYVRAYALRRLDRAAQADALVESAWRVRPHSVESAGAALFASGQAGHASASPYGVALARLNPRLIAQLFDDAVRSGDYARAVNLFDQLVAPTRPVERENAAGFEEDMVYNWIQRTLFWAQHRGQYAVALAGLGRTDEARAVLAAARAGIAAAMKSPPPPDNFFVAGSMKAHIAKVAPSLEQKSVAMVDEAARTIDQMASGAKAPEPEPFDTAAEMDSLLHYLPLAEDKALTPLFGKARKGTLGLLANAAWYWEEGDATWFSFRIFVPSQSITGEMALLGVAQRARELGKKGFIIIDRHDVRHVTILSFPNVPGERGGDLETQLAVVFVDPSALPPKYAGQAWRVLEADPIYEALAPIYGAPVLKSATPRGQALPSLE